jgi:hypothetical protein
MEILSCPANISNANCQNEGSLRYLDGILKYTTMMSVIRS